MIDQLSLCLFAEYLTSAQRAASGSFRDQAVNNFLRYIEEHFGDADCLLQAHRAARISRTEGTRKRLTPPYLALLLRSSNLTPTTKGLR